MDLDDEELEATRKMHKLQEVPELEVYKEDNKKLYTILSQYEEKLGLIREILKSKFLKYDENEDEFDYEDIIVNKQIEKIRKIVGE